MQAWMLICSPQRKFKNGREKSRKIPSTMPVRYLSSDVRTAEQGRGNTERRRLDMHVNYAVTSPGFHLAPAPSMT